MKAFKLSNFGVVLEDALYVGNLAAATDGHLLEELGVSDVLTVALNLLQQGAKQLHHGDGVVPSSMKHRVIDLIDSPDANVLQVLPKCLDFIDDGLENGRRVLVHCASGVSRSVTTCAAYLMTRRGMTLDQALAQIREGERFGNIERHGRPTARPNEGFLLQLRILETCNGDIQQAQLSWKAKLEEMKKSGKTVMDNVREAREEARSLYQSVDDIENTWARIKASNKIDQVSSLHEELESLVQGRIKELIGELNDRPALSMLKSAREKAERLLSEIEELL